MTPDPGTGVVDVVEVGVNDGVTEGVVHPKVDMIWSNTADSAALSKFGGGGSMAPRECSTKSMLMQAFPWSVE